MWEVSLLCEIIPIIVAYIFYRIRINDPLKLTVISWATLATLSIIPCKTLLSKVAIESIDSMLKNNPDLYHLTFNIFAHNLIVDLMCFVLGKAYLGYMLTTTAFVAHQLARGYPWRVLFSAHTLLELYAYSLSTRRTLRDLVKSTVYLVLAALIESWFIINPA